MNNQSEIQWVTIPGEVPSKKNSKRIVHSKGGGRPLLISNAKYYEWEKSVLPGLKALNLHYDGHVDLYFALTRKTRRRFDWNNISQAITDVFVKAGIIVDDDALHCTPVFKGFCYDKEYPHCMVGILESESKLWEV